MAHFLDKAKGQFSAVRDSVTDTLHSVRNADANAEKLQGQFQDLLNMAPQFNDNATRDIKETEGKAEKFKGEIKHLIHKGPQFYDKAKEEIKGRLFHKNGEENGETSSPVKTSIPVHDIKMEEENNFAAVGTTIPVQTSVPVHDNKIEEENNFAAVETAILVQVSDTKNEEQNTVAAFFARIFEKCCGPFNKKKD